MPKDPNKIPKPADGENNEPAVSSGPNLKFQDTSIKPPQKTPQLTFDDKPPVDTSMLPTASKSEIKLKFGEEPKLEDPHVEGLQNTEKTAWHRVQEIEENLAKLDQEISAQSQEYKKNMDGVDQLLAKAQENSKAITELEKAKALLGQLKASLMEAIESSATTTLPPELVEDPNMPEISLPETGEASDIAEPPALEELLGMPQDAPSLKQKIEQIKNQRKQARAQKQFAKMKPEEVTGKIPDLLESGIEPEAILARLHEDSKQKLSSKAMDVLLDHGASPEAVSELRNRHDLESIEVLNKHGVDTSGMITKWFVDGGADMFRMGSPSKTLVERLLNCGASLDTVTRYMARDVFAKSADVLLEHGADPQAIYDKIASSDESVLKALGPLLEHGVKIDLQQLLKNCDPTSLTLKTAKILLKYGADPSVLRKKLLQKKGFSLWDSIQLRMIHPAMTIDDIGKDLPGYLENDLDLSSNLLTYALKERIKNGESLESIFSSSPSLQEKLKNLPEDHLAKLAERIKNLEILETKHYIFMLPKDKWEEGKIKLPNPEGDPDAPEFIAPANLTAILKGPVNYDWYYETDGFTTKKPYRVYDESWVGKEIKHFPWSKELIREANEKLLKPNGFHIPKVEEWEDICNNLKTLLAIEKNTSENNINTRRLSTALRERFNLAISGFVFRGDLEYPGSIGEYWSASGYSAYEAFRLLLELDTAYPGASTDRGFACSVRCVSSPQQNIDK